jgi:hypothetical protein
MKLDLKFFKVVTNQPTSWGYESEDIAYYDIEKEATDEARRRHSELQDPNCIEDDVSVEVTNEKDEQILFLRLEEESITEKYLGL